MNKKIIIAIIIISALVVPGAITYGAISYFNKDTRNDAKTDTVNQGTTKTAEEEAKDKRNSEAQTIVDEATAVSGSKYDEAIEKYQRARDIYIETKNDQKVIEMDSLIKLAEEDKATAKEVKPVNIPMPGTGQ